MPPLRRRRGAWHAVPVSAGDGSEVTQRKHRGKRRGRFRKGERPPTRGNVPPRVEYERRLNLVEELLVQGVPVHKVIHLVREDATRREVAPPPTRTVERYVRVVRDRLREARDAVRASEVDIRLARLHNLSRKMEREGAWGALSRIETLITDVVGTRAPKRVEVSGTINHVVVSADLRHFSDDELRQMQELNAKFITQLERRGVRAQPFIDADAETVEAPALPAAGGAR